MSSYEIPEECLNDPQFVTNFISTMCREISKKEEMLSDADKLINKSKETLRRGLEQRATIKPLIEIEKEKKCLLESTRQSSHASESQLGTQVALISARMDDKSLKDKAYLERYSDIVEMHKTTWLTRQAEYEKLPAAVERKNKKVEYQLVNTRLMMLKQNEKDLKNIIRIQENINALRLTKKIVEMVEMLRDRLEKQRIREEQREKNLQLKRELEILADEKAKLLKLKEEEERSKLKARQLMPPPKLDLKFIRTFYTAEKSNGASQIENKRATRLSSDSDDNISITTAIIEDMCKDQDDVTGRAGDTNYEDSQSVPRSISGLVMRQNRQEKGENSSTEGIEVLEKTYRQLSLEKDDNPPENSPIEVQVLIKDPKKSSPQKLKSILRKSVDQTEGLSGAKRSRLEEISEISEEEHVEKLQEVKTKKSEELPKKNAPITKDRQLPQVQSIETINRPIVVASKPLIAEITPTPSNLFSPRHYVSSSFEGTDGSTFNHDFDNILGAENPLNTKMDMNFTGNMDWGHDFSPPPNPALQSDASFTSNISAFKNPDIDIEVEESHKPENAEGSNWTFQFGAGKSGRSLFQ